MLNTKVYDDKLNALIERGSGATLEHNTDATHEVTAEIAELIMYCHTQGLVLHTEDDGYMHFIANGYSPSALSITTYERDGRTYQ